jgi:CubicO group peptidase (beta-lactamase class C family)
VYRDGKIIYAKGYGLANVEQGVAITPQSVFDVGSIAKQFTAASILLLEKQGKLRLDDNIRKYIPELPDYSLQTGESITLLHLLNHTSGLRDYVALLLLAGVHTDNVTTDDDALGVIVRQRGLNFVPGSDWQYGGSGYFLLSLVVKRVSGKTLKDFAAENIFRPLGMAYTQYRNDHASLIPKRVLAYEPTESGGYRLSVSYAEQNGDGMVHTSIEDLQKWDENFYSGRVGGRDLSYKMQELGKLTDGSSLDYAKGVFIGEYRGLRATWHSGWTGGYRTFLLRFPEQHFSVACFCNNGRSASKRAYAVADAYLAREMKEGVLPVNAAPERLHAWAGTYRDSRKGDVCRIYVADGKLRVDLGDAVVELRTLSATVFDSADNPFLRLTFDLGRNNTARRLTVRTFGLSPATLEPLEEAKPTAAELAAYEGDYWSTELRVTYRLAMKDGKLWMKEVIGSDGIVHAGVIPSNDLRPVLSDEFDLRGVPVVFRFKRAANGHVIGFTLNGFRERGIEFDRLTSPK